MCEQCETRPWGTCPCGCGKARGPRGCTAHSKATKLLCQSTACKKNGHHVCKSHGGTRKRGVGAGDRFIHGLYSKAIPARYLDRYIESLEDRNQLQLHRQIAMLDAREVELLEKLDSETAKARFLAGRAAFEALVKGLNKKPSKEQQGQITAIRRAFEGEATDRETWSDLLQLYDRRKDYAREQVRMNLAEEQAMPAAQVLTLISVVVHGARRFIPDEDDLEAFGRLVAGYTPGGMEALEIYENLNAADDPDA